MNSYGYLRVPDQAVAQANYKREKQEAEMRVSIKRQIRVKFPACPSLIG